MVPRPSSVVICYRNVLLLGFRFSICQVKVSIISTFSSALAICATHVLAPVSGPWRVGHMYFQLYGPSETGRPIQVPPQPPPSISFHTYFSPGLCWTRGSWTWSHVTSSRLTTLGTTVFPFLIWVSAPHWG